MDTVLGIGIACIIGIISYSVFVILLLHAQKRKDLGGLKLPRLYETVQVLFLGICFVSIVGALLIRIQVLLANHYHDDSQKSLRELNSLHEEEQRRKIAIADEIFEGENPESMWPLKSYFSIIEHDEKITAIREKYKNILKS